MKVWLLIAFLSFGLFVYLSIHPSTFSFLSFFFFFFFSIPVVLLFFLKGGGASVKVWLLITFLSFGLFAYLSIHPSIYLPICSYFARVFQLVTFYL